MGISLRHRHPHLAMLAWVVAAASTVGSAGFGLLVGGDSGTIGTFERLALWPGYAWVSVAALTCRRPRLGSQHADPAHL
jgi:hypothetical protein